MNFQLYKINLKFEKQYNIIEVILLKLSNLSFKKNILSMHSIFLIMLKNKKKLFYYLYENQFI